MSSDILRKLHCLDEKTNKLLNGGHSPYIYYKVKDAIVTLTMNHKGRYYSGSGFLFAFNNEIYVITCAHNVVFWDINDLVSNVYATVINVNGEPGVSRVYKCEIIGIDGAGDIAVLKPKSDQINAFKHPSLRFSDNTKELKGDFCTVIGNPFGFDHNSIASGIIRDESCTYSSFWWASTVECISTDVATSPGNSGSPILNKNGHVIGMLTFGPSNAEGISNGPSSKIIKYVIDTILDEYRFNLEVKTKLVNGVRLFVKGWLGISWKDITAMELAILFNHNIPDVNVQGLYVMGDLLGNFKRGDILLTINGIKLGSLEGHGMLSDVTWFKKGGDIVTIEYMRAPSTNTLSKSVALIDMAPLFDYPLIGNNNTKLSNETVRLLSKQEINK